MQILEGENGKNEDFSGFSGITGALRCFGSGRGGVFYPPCMADTGENAEREGGKRGEIAPRVRPVDGAL